MRLAAAREESKYCVYKDPSMVCLLQGEPEQKMYFETLHSKEIDPIAYALALRASRLADANQRKILK